MTPSNSSTGTLPFEREPGTTADMPPALASFHAPLREWFRRSFAAPTRAQELAWPLIFSGQSTLILAPTGSGKTLAAFLAAIDHLMFEPVPSKQERCRVLYISPLKALAVDVERNLRAPLVGVSRYAEQMGVPFHPPEVAIRTGDTPSRERAQFARNPADILITTPESLYLLLTSNARDALRSVRWVIIDEIHALVGTKRGAHLALSLERLEELTGQPLQRIGLSATVRPVDEAMRFLGGYEIPVDPEAVADPTPEELAAEWTDRDEPERDTPEPAAAVSRPVAVVDAGRRKQLEIVVEVPVEDMAKLGQPIEVPSGPADQGEVRGSIWPAIHPMVLDLIKQHRSTIVFVNSRRLAERMASALNELAGEEIVRAHHGSLAREQRQQIEDALKAGQLPAMVATSSLELGIDMGAVDLVIQVESPPSVASAIQRIGRAGHQIGAPSEGVIIPKYRGDLLACAALTERMRNGEVEPLSYPRNPLDVLAQHIVSMVALDEWNIDALERVIRRAAPFSELPRSMLEGVLDMLSGRYPSDEFAELRPRITWDRLSGQLTSREGAKRIAISSGGTIPDRGLYGVFLLNSGEAGTGSRKPSLRVGELDEEMVFETRIGETFILGASTWRVEEITHDRVLVSPAPGQPGKMPFWHGDSPGRPLEFGRAIGALCRRLRELIDGSAAEPEDAGKGKGRRKKGLSPSERRDEAVRLLVEEHALTEGAARNLLAYLEEQLEATGVVPDDRTLVVERYMDEMGDWRVCLLSPFGSRVHAPWALAIEALVRERSDLDVDLMWTDDGIVVRFPEADEPPPLEAVLPDPDEVEDLVMRQLGSSALFAARFREAAGRALLLPRRYPGQRAPLWQQRRKAADLLRAAAEYGSFPMILESYRECLRDVFDMPSLVELLRDVRRRSVRTVAVTTRTPSPFAASLLFNYIGNFMYEGDAPLAERRAAALSVDQSQLRELLGDLELRDLLDPDALETVELQLQHLTPERKAKHVDALHDLLIRLGDLTRDEIADRSTEPPDAWLAHLEQSRRVVRLTIAGEPRYIAAEDVGRYRDALGIPPPPGLPAAFLEFVRDPLGDLIARYARTHGPFTTGTIAARFGLGIGPVATTLAALERSGRLIQGEFRPGGTGREWCDSGVLRSIRQKSLARLRKEVEPVEQAALGRFYPAWQNVRHPRKGPDALLEVVEQLQGAALPALDLEARILPVRLDRYQPHELDMLLASGVLIWVGVEPIGDHDGRIALYLVEHAPLLLPGKRPDAPEGPLHQKIREHLSTRGASFFAQILQACGGGFAREVQDALWDLVWAGEVTNDTLQPLRSFLAPKKSKVRSSSASLRGFRARTTFPPEVQGRWSLVSSFLFSEPSATERLTARARQLLDRYGVLTREVVQAEGLEGGFSSIYGVLKALEESGKIRRGYFVAGCGATQFAMPGAVDRLRQFRDPEESPRSVLLAATDPANPYGTALPWSGRSSDSASNDSGDGGKPSTTSGRRPARAAGAFVVLVDGALAAWMGRRERNLVTFLDQVPDRGPEDVAAEIARALADEVDSGRRRSMFVKEVDGLPAQQTLLGPALAAEGFVFGPSGYMRRGSY